MRASGLVGLLAGLTIIGALGATACNPIQQSHIDGNVPPKDQFNEILQRDLDRYFSAKAGSDVDVTYELLRRGPTQSGVAAPKYYIWAVVNAADGSKFSGAVRLAAVENVEFSVTHFLSAKDIRANPSAAEQVFPKVLVPRIQELAAQP